MAKDNGFPEGNSSLEDEINQFYDSLLDVEFDGHDGQIANVLKTLTGEEELLIDGISGRRTLELVMAIYKSGTTGERVKLPIAIDDPFYSREGVLKYAPHFHEKTISVESVSEEISHGSEYKL